MEFERRYEAMPHVCKAELVEGIVYMTSPERITQHSEPHAEPIGWLYYSRSKTPGPRIGGNATVRLDDDYEPQPDAMLLLPRHAGGAANVDEDEYVAGSPKLLCEVSASTLSIDLHQKLEAYLLNGVKEYLVWRVQDETVDWFHLVGDAYEAIQPDRSGLICSRVLAGLWLDVAALLRGDVAAVLAGLNRGVTSEEHRGNMTTLVGPSEGFPT